MSIEVRHLHKAFGRTVVCDGLNLDIPAGELVAKLLVAILTGGAGSDPPQAARPAAATMSASAQDRMDLMGYSLYLLG